MLQNKAEKPVFGTREWASYNANCVSGCSHDCLYCYAKSMAIRFGRKTPDNWENETFNQSKLVSGFRKRQGRIMFPTSHDITPEHLDGCMAFLENMLKVGNEVLIVSKPHIDCIKSICARFNRYRQQILFRFTIGSADNATLRFWEPYAPGFDERLESLSYAYRSGYATSVSCEPLLDNKADDLVRQLRPYVTDAIWFGKGNRMITRLKSNGHKDAETLQRAEKLMADLSDEYIIGLYNRHKDNSQIKWKESVKKVVGIDIPVECGLDI